MKSRTKKELITEITELKDKLIVYGERHQTITLNLLVKIQELEKNIEDILCEDK